MGFDQAKHKRQARLNRRKRVRKRIKGVAERPRLNVFRSARHIYAQLIDDSTGRTLVAASSLSKDFKSEQTWGGNVAAAKVVGRLIAEKAQAQGISQVVFDRNGFRYHGRVKTLADAAREGGLKF